MHAGRPPSSQLRGFKKKKMERYIILKFFVGNRLIGLKRNEIEYCH